MRRGVVATASSDGVTDALLDALFYLHQVLLHLSHNPALKGLQHHLEVAVAVGV